MTETKILKNNWEAETNASGGTLSYSQRSGNLVKVFEFSAEDFVDLYSVVLAIAQLHPEWTQ